MNRQHTLSIMEKHKLSHSHSGRIAGLEASQILYYKTGRVGKIVSEKIEDAIIEWERQLNEKRCRLLIGTGWEYLYCNQ